MRSGMPVALEVVIYVGDLELAHAAFILKTYKVHLVEAGLSWIKDRLIHIQDVDRV